jgi:hypothetical protein
MEYNLRTDVKFGQDAELTVFLMIEAATVTPTGY